MSFAIDLADVDELVELIDDVEGIRSVSVEADKVNPPGVWVQVQGFTFDRLAGYTLNAQLLLVVPDKNPKRAMTDLAALLNKVLTVVKPTGPVLARTVVLPHTSAALPGLAVPLAVHCTPGETP